METERARISRLALGSLILGFASFVLGFLTGIPAAISGHVARYRIRKSGGRLTGDGAAVTGLFLGYALSVLWVLVIVAIGCFGILGPRNKVVGRTALEHSTALVQAVDSFYSEYSRLPEVSSHDFTTLDPEGQRLLRALWGDERLSENMLSPRQISFLRLNEARNGRGGMLFANDGRVIGLVDSWGNPYRVVLNRDAEIPLRFRYGDGTEEVLGRNVIVASRGPDGVEGTKDDIKSWALRKR